MSKQKKSGKRHSSKTLSDVTINDFANSTVCKNRLKKSNNVKNLVQKELEEKPWDEKTDEYEGEFVEIENEDGTITHVIRKQSEPRRRKKTVSTSDENINNEGREYPLDIWFLLSEYIRPEDVGRFAGISRGSFEVVNRASFWFSIYKRYYHSVPNLPERLQPENLLRKYSLRTSVIRALHYMYPPFILRVKSAPTLEEHPDVLVKRQCVLMWYQYQEENKRWIYYFKMKEDTSNLPPHYRRPNIQKPDLLEMLDDVSANPDDSCQVLQVTCVNFIAVAPVLGLTLTSVSMHLSQGFMHHRLQLGFGNSFQAKGKKSATDGGTGCTVIILDPVINVRVLNWWHPLYPHGHTMELLMNQG